jgi:predicted DNA binding protein
MYELLLGVRHTDCPYWLISTINPKVLVSHWCNDRTEVLEGVGPAEGLKSVSQAIRDLANKTGCQIQYESLNLDSGRMLMVIAGSESSRTCMCDLVMHMSRCTSVTSQIESEHCLAIQPILYQNGWEKHRFIAFDASQLKVVLKGVDSLGEVKILSKRIINGDIARDLFTISLSSVFSGLTKKQLEALVDAISQGYYTVPRPVTVHQLARARDVPRTTFEEHFHKAESKLIRSIAPYIQMYAAGQLVPNP